MTGEPQTYPSPSPHFGFLAITPHTVKRIRMCSPKLTLPLKPVHDDLFPAPLFGCSLGISPIEPQSCFSWCNLTSSHASGQGKYSQFQRLWDLARAALSSSKDSFLGSPGQQFSEESVPRFCSLLKPPSASTLAPGLLSPCPRDVSLSAPSSEHWPSFPRSFWVVSLPSRAHAGLSLLI